ncbi:MAG: glycoside hydrolase family 88 protein [Lachnospiraceae bacterium]|nr:glycoside hydrolase family 88 protein [Lachnospiraceae bacterium]
MTQQIESLLTEAKRQLFSYPETTKKEDLKRLVKKIIRPGTVARKDPFFWQHAMLTQALEEAKEAKTLKRYYESWLNKGLPVYNIDGVMNGYSLLYFYEQSKDANMLAAGEALYQYLLRYKEQSGGTIPYRKHHPTHIYVDGIGMMVPFLSRYGKIAGREEASSLAAEQLKLFWENGMDSKSGLPYHGYDTETKEKQGIIGWGRAVGWLALGLADSLEFLPADARKKELNEAFRCLVEAVMAYLREDGYFSWQLQAAEGPKDTSATAMIAYAVQKGIAVGALTEGYEKQLIGMEQAILKSVKEGRIYDCSGECEGFSQYPQIYGAYPWSLGPGLRFLLLRKKMEHDDSW